MEAAPPTQQSWVPQQDRDEQHLKLLAMFWHIYAALNVIGGCVGLFYVGFGVFFLLADVDQSGGDAPPEAIGWVMVVAGAFVLFLTVLFAVLDVMVGLSLPKHKRYILCLVVAAIACLSVPLGTVLGVFTFIVLGRPTVKAKFDAVKAGQPRP